MDIREFGMGICTLLSTYFKWITNNVLLYSTGNCLMSCSSLDGRGVWGRMDTCIHMAESLRYSTETIMTLLIGYTPI